MRIVSALAGLTTVSMLFFAAPGFACEAAGPGKHVGQVIEVDRDAGTFSIMDAEKMTAIQFSAADRILDKVENTDRTAIVDFEDTGAGLEATRVALQ